MAPSASQHPHLLEHWPAPTGTLPTGQGHIPTAGNHQCDRIRHSQSAITATTRPDPHGRQLPTCQGQRLTVNKSVWWQGQALTVGNYRHDSTRPSRSAVTNVPGPEAHGQQVTMMTGPGTYSRQLPTRLDQTLTVGSYILTCQGQRLTVNKSPSWQSQVLRVGNYQRHTAWYLQSVITNVTRPRFTVAKYQIDRARYWESATTNVTLRCIYSQLLPTWQGDVLQSAITNWTEPGTHESVVNNVTGPGNQSWQSPARQGKVLIAGNYQLHRTS